MSKNPNDCTPTSAMVCQYCTVKRDCTKKLARTDISLKKQGRTILDKKIIITEDSFTY